MKLEYYYDNDEVMVKTEMEYTKGKAIVHMYPIYPELEDIEGIIDLMTNLVRGIDVSIQHFDKIIVHTTGFMKTYLKEKYSYTRKVKIVEKEV